MATAHTEAEMLLKAKSGTTDKAWHVVTTVMGRKRSLSTVEDEFWGSGFLVRFSGALDCFGLSAGPCPLLTQRKMAIMLKLAANSIALGR